MNAYDWLLIVEQMQFSKIIKMIAESGLINLFKPLITRAPAAWSLEAPKNLAETIFIRDPAVLRHKVACIKSGPFNVFAGIQQSL